MIPLLPIENLACDLAAGDGATVGAWTNTSAAGVQLGGSVYLPGLANTAARFSLRVELLDDTGTFAGGPAWVEPKPVAGETAALVALPREACFVPAGWTIRVRVKSSNAGDTAIDALTFWRDESDLAAGLNTIEVTLACNLAATDGAIVGAYVNTSSAGVQLGGTVHLPGLANTAAMLSLRVELLDDAGTPVLAGGSAWVEIKPVAGETSALVALPREACYVPAGWTIRVRVKSSNAGDTSVDALTFWRAESTLAARMDTLDAALAAQNNLSQAEAQAAATAALAAYAPATAAALDALNDLDQASVQTAATAALVAFGPATAAALAAQNNLSQAEAQAAATAALTAYAPATAAALAALNDLSTADLAAALAADPTMGQVLVTLAQLLSTGIEYAGPIDADGVVTVDAGGDYTAATGNALAFTVDGLPFDMTGGSAWLGIQGLGTYQTTDRTDALVSADMTITPSGDDWILSADLTASETEQLEGTTDGQPSYIYQIILVLADGTRHRLTTGNLIADKMIASP